MAKTIAQFTIVRTGEDYQISIEDEDGDTAEFIADYDQLDLMVEALDQQLNADEEEALEADDDDEEAETVDEED